MLLMTIIVATPMIRFVVDSPDVYMARELHGAKLVSESLDSAHFSRLKLYSRNLATSLLMFNYEGDGNSRFGVPYLSPASAEGAMPCCFSPSQFCCCR